MSSDLLARIAKALEEFNGVPRNTLNLGVAARTLLPEAHAALKIAVEALERVATGGLTGVSEAGCMWCLDFTADMLDGSDLVLGGHLDGCPVAAALCRLTSAAEKPRGTE